MNEGPVTVETYGGPLTLRPAVCVVCGGFAPQLTTAYLAGFAAPYCLPCARSQRVAWPVAVGQVRYVTHLFTSAGEPPSSAALKCKPDLFFNEIALDSLHATCEFFGKSWDELIDDSRA